jgi:hypothetical protein
VRFAVDIVNRNGGQSPKIQIWRPNGTQLQTIYYKSGQEVPIVDSSEVCLRRRRNNGRVFRCTLNEAYQVSVRPGDILGLELPSEIDDDFDIIFTEPEPGPENYVFEGSLTSPANLSEASTVTNHMPQINFTVMLGKYNKPLATKSNTVHVLCDMLNLFHFMYAHSHIYTHTYTHVLKILKLQMEMMDQMWLCATSLLCCLLKKELFLYRP